ncbi:hypothetical protein OS493_020106 [Desmophyllum pertusum]|uniref:RRM domain-containing protein n=1 Tax=Desmophyllum pertusum TaxID=174260 RepID=A0A9X0A1G9_9CNID|nr:hypothetical protein OS493_020106 [Desmophyllum pertusum]
MASESSDRSLFVRGCSWEEAPSDEAIMEHFTCYGQVDHVSVTRPKVMPESWIAVVSFFTLEGAQLTFTNRSSPNIRCFRGSFLCIDFFRIMVSKRQKKEWSDKKVTFIDSGWTFPVKVAKKKKRVKAARRAREQKVLEMWNPLAYRDKVSLCAC